MLRPPMSGNAGMRRTSQRVGFTIRPVPDDQSVVLAELALGG